MLPRCRLAADGWAARARVLGGRAVEGEEMTNPHYETLLAEISNPATTLARIREIAVMDLTGLTCDELTHRLGNRLMLRWLAVQEIEARERRVSGVANREAKSVE